MVQVEMNRDIREFEPKVIGPFTLKQAKCVGVMAAYGFPLFFTLYKHSLYTAAIVVGISIAPPILIGWVKVRNMSFEKFFIRWFYWRIRTPRIRRYKSKPYLKEFVEAEEKKIENDKIAAMSKRELKKYEKEKIANSRVRYSKNPEYKAFR